MGFTRESCLVTTQWVQTHRTDPDVVVLDCRWKLQDPAYGAAVYRQGHIPGARRVDLDQDLSAPVERYGGRHPLPEPGYFEARMRRIGINASSTVVVYDDDAAGAARAWWCLTYFGHASTVILNGGIVQWRADGGPLESGSEPPMNPGSFRARPDPRMVVGYATVRHLQHAWPIIDARAPERYTGAVEPIDAYGGHIPGAVNVPYSACLTENGRYRTAAEIRQLCGPIVDLAGPDPIVYCGSGVTACVLAAALHSAGANPLVYPGSWSDWISHEGAPIATGPLAG